MPQVVTFYTPLGTTYNPPVSTQEAPAPCALLASPSDHPVKKIGAYSGNPADKPYAGAVKSLGDPTVVSVPTIRYKVSTT